MVFGGEMKKVTFPVADGLAYIYKALAQLSNAQQAAFL